MTVFLLMLTGFFAGSFGALLGLGGGIIVIPILTIFFHLPIHTAIGVSLVGVIATSTGAAVVYVREGKANVRLGMTLELATTIGAIVGAVVADYVSARVLYLLFAMLVGYNAYSMYRKSETAKMETAVGLQQNEYEIKRVPLGLFISSFAGILSGLLGVGGGLIKVPVMYLLMGVPLKVAAATSNFMIGVTATASALIYYFNGRIDVAAAVPVALGVFAGAALGSRFNTRISTRALKRIFVLVFVYIAVEMALKGLGR